MRHHLASLSRAARARSVAIGAFALLSAGAAHAGGDSVVTFGGLNPYTGIDAAKPLYDEAGLTFADPTYGLASGFKHGFAAAIAMPSTITITPQAGGAFASFNFVSEQFTQLNDANPAFTIQFVGTRADGSQVRAALDVAGFADIIYTFAPEGFTDLVSLTESSAGGFMVFDNFTFNTTSAVPEPSPALLLLAGLGVAGAVVRRRKLG